MTNAKDLPKELPILTPANMYIGSYSGPNGTHCLSGWVRVVYVDRDFDFTHTPLYKALGGDHRCAVCVYNDMHTPAQNADLWNRTAKELGYIQRDGKWVRPDVYDEAVAFFTAHPELIAEAPELTIAVRAIEGLPHNHVMVKEDSHRLPAVVKALPLFARAQRMADAALGREPL